MKPKVQWRPKEIWESKNMECLLKITGSKEKHPMWEATRTTTNNAVDVGLPIPFRTHILHNFLWLLDMELQDLMFALLCSDLPLVLFLSILLPQFGIKRLTLYHCMLEVFNILFWFYRGSQLRLCLNLKVDVGLIFFSNSGTIKTLVTLKRWTKCILHKEMCIFWWMEWNVMNMWLGDVSWLKAGHQGHDLKGYILLSGSFCFSAFWSSWCEQHSSAKDLHI